MTMSCGRRFCAAFIFTLVGLVFLACVRVSDQSNTKSTQTPAACAAPMELVKLFTARTNHPPSEGLPWATVVPKIVEPTRLNNFRFDACANWGDGSLKIVNLVTLGGDGKTIVNWKPKSSYAEIGKAMVSASLFDSEMRFRNTSGEEFLVRGINNGNSQFIAGAKADSQGFVNNEVVLGKIEWGDPFSGEYCEEGGLFNLAKFDAGEFAVASEVCSFQGDGNTTGYRIQKLDIMKNGALLRSFVREEIHQLDRQGANSVAPASGEGVWYKYLHHNHGDSAVIRIKDLQIETVTLDSSRWSLVVKTTQATTEVQKSRHPFLP